MESYVKHLNNTINYHTNNSHIIAGISMIILNIGTKYGQTFDIENSKKNTYVLNDKNNESKQNLDTCKILKGIRMKAIPLFYVDHTSGTKNKWMKQMVKSFLCHKSTNKFDINETGDYVDNT